ncbi:MAG: SGNH/GDSL hydrolase family protein [Alistipes sp.]
MKKQLFVSALIFSFIVFCAAQLAAASSVSCRRIVFIGDSITDGNWGKGDGRPTAERNLTDRNHLYGSGYMYLCAAHYQSRYPDRDYLFFNRGVSGNTLDELAARWSQDVIALKPDLLSVLIGSNDVSRYISSLTSEADAAAREFDFAGWEATYRQLLDQARQANPRLQIVLCTPFAVRAGALKTEKFYSLREQLLVRCAEVVKHLAADYGAAIVPFQQLVAGLEGQQPAGDDTYWVWDGIHPTPACHRRMADCWIKTVTKKHFLR